MIQPSFRAVHVDQQHTKWQVFNKIEIRRQMYGSQSTQAMPHCHTFVNNIF